MLRHARARGISLDWTFYCVLGRPGDLDDEAHALGAGVIHAPVPIGRKVTFARALRAELRKGDYQVLHCHHDLVSALYLLAACGLQMRRKIVHVHNEDEEVLTPSRRKQALFRAAGRRICLSLADRLVGISNHTLETFLSGAAYRPGQHIVHYYGVDPAPFETIREDRQSLRRRIGLPEDALILLFAGRLVHEKNPLFAVDVLAELRQLEPRAIGVFAGDGELTGAIRARAQQQGVEEAVRILGWRDDVMEIMTCSDWFILTRPDHRSKPREGFGLAIVEAQLAGLRLLLSDAIAPDPLLPTAIFRQLPLISGPKEWAQAAMELLSERPSSRDAITALSQSPMDMDYALENLLALHQ